MAVVWGGLGNGLDIEPTDSWLFLVRLELLCEKRNEAPMYLVGSLL